MKTISRYIMTLALLITAVGGAWAQTPTIYFQQDYATETVDWSTATSGRFTPIVENGYLTVNQNQRQNNGTTLTCTATQGKVDAGKDFTMTFNVKLGASTNQSATAFNIYDAANSAPILSFAEGSVGATAWRINQGTQTATVSAGGGKSLDELSWIFVQVTYIAGENAKTYLTLKDDQNNIIDGFDKTEIPTLSEAGGLGKMTFVTSRYLANFAIDNVLVSEVVDDDPSSSEPTIDVTTNKAEGETTFTEASFTMPPFDATADYELVRDMSIQMTTKVGNAADGADYRIRIKKDNQTGKFVPAEMNPQAMAGLITVTDDIEEKTLTNVTDYTVSIFAVDGDNNPTGDAIAFADLVPGRYVAIATAADGSAYDGATEQSNVFVLFQGYEVEVPAKEFITYYKDEPLYADTETSADAELYTISSVNGDQAVLSDAIETAPSLTPLLIYNKGDQDKTFLLIPVDAEPNLAITVAPEFQGTLTGTTIAASTENQTNYALNGKAFVFVKNDLAVGANKAWLSISNSNARAINLVFDETTKITTTNLTNITNGDWYDLNGRKLDGMPTKKGVYIMNGRKVVVK